MNDASVQQNNLCTKIARLVEERGWNQEDFARLAELNRLTVRSIFQGSPRRLHNATVAGCARALGLSVHDLRELSLEKLLPRMQTVNPPEASPSSLQEEPASVPSADVNRLYENATQPELLAWAENNRDRADQLSPEDWDELLSLQGTGGPLTSLGVNHFVDQIERRRRLTEKVATIAGTDYIDLLEQFVETLYSKIQPYRDRK
jgi:transcriptional regulator with XRE-family HTH domain